MGINVKKITESKIRGCYSEQYKFTWLHNNTEWWNLMTADSIGSFNIEIFRFSKVISLIG